MKSPMTRLRNSCWNGFHLPFDLTPFFQSNLFSDARIVTSNGKFISVHKLVLASGCPIIETALRDGKQDGEDEVVVILPDFDLEEIFEEVKLMYGIKGQESKNETFWEVMNGGKVKNLDEKPNIFNHEINTVSEKVKGQSEEEIDKIAEDDIRTPRYTLKRHYPTDVDGQLMCPVVNCQYKSEDRRKIHNHVSVVHRKVKCPKCPKVMSRKNVAGHVARMHNHNLSDDICDSQSDSDRKDE